MNKLSSDDGCKMQRWNRVLLWGAVTLIFVLPAIAQGIVRDPSHHMSFVFAVFTGTLLYLQVTINSVPMR
jgi:Na+/melibiose symporter-like transporter